MDEKDKQEQSNDKEERPAIENIKFVLAIVGILILGGILLFVIVAIAHTIGLVPGNRSFLGEVPWWDPDGMSIFDRISEIAGW